MNTNNLLQNGIPQGLFNIPCGQIFILTNPALGIGSNHIYLMECIISMAGKLNKVVIIHDLSVDCPGLWDCVICKVKTDKGDQILVSKKCSLIEMLCVFWGLDLYEVCKSTDISKRYRETCLGEEHPMRYPVPVDIKTDEKECTSGIFLQCIKDKSETDILDEIRKALRYTFTHNQDISIEEIIDLYNKEKANCKKYKLDIHIERGEPIDDQPGKISKCEVSLIDNAGNRYPLNLESQILTLYLTFIYYGGFDVLDIGDGDVYETYMKILSQLPHGYAKPSSETVMENAYSRIAKIKKIIMDATNDSYAVEQFSVDGYKGQEYKVEGATGDDRDIIRKEFDLM